jgi:diguanylate cyclase (GGDEF)-like protein
MNKESILIIDPDENSNYLLSLLIERVGYRFRAVQDLDKGLDHLKNEPFTLVILDVSLLEPQQLLKIQDLRRDLCFIFTGESVKEVRDYIKPDISDFLSKPFILEEAEFRLKRIILQRAALSRHEEAEKELQAAREQLGRKDRDLESSMDDLERIKRLYKDIGGELNATSEKLHRAKDQLEILATTDGLTEVYNHRHFMDQIHERFEEAKKCSSPLSLLMIDIDHFKAFNDNHGHMAGDLVLKKIAQLLKASCRTQDIVARYGGEEFAIILSETDLQRAETVAERVRSVVEHHRLVDGTQSQPITVSVGIGALHDGIDTVNDLIASADKALYQAKTEGRNRVRRDRGESSRPSPIPPAQG